METAHDRAAVDLRQTILSSATSPDDVIKDFTRPGVGVNSSNPDARLNSAILIAELAAKGDLNADKALRDMLTNADPSVRYWAARGLGSIAKGLLLATAAGGAIRDLDAAATKETSGVVEQEIIKTLIKYEAFEPILHALDNVSSQIKSTIPDLGMLQAAATGLDAIASKVPGAAAALKEQAAKVAVSLASFSIQQAKVYEAGQKAVEATVSQEYLDAVRHVTTAAARVAGAAAGKTYRPPAGSSLDELELNVNTLFGTPPAGGSPAKPGQVQADIKAVPPPAAIAPPATAPATTPQ